MKVQEFQQLVWDYYERHGRHELPWRVPEADGSFDPYKITVSEIMLQQTQVSRVIPKYLAFLERFPTVYDLASAEQGEVLRVWQGLGYNRRAKFLWQAARMVVDEHGGLFPADETLLVKLPGIGKNTAGAILAYAFNQPIAYIETNIRTVFIHHFYPDKVGVPDSKILNLVRLTAPWNEGKEQPETRIHSAPGALRKTVGLSQPRLWYWALMDYGNFTKQAFGNLNKLSKHYVKQSKFHGSKRQIRGAVLRELAIKPATLPFLQRQISDERLDAVLAELVEENLITCDAGKYSL